MPKSIDDYRAEIIGGKETVQCGFRIDGCEGGMVLDSAWVVDCNLEAVFSGEEWESEFPDGFSLDQLTADHLVRAKLVSCHFCKSEVETAMQETRGHKPPYKPLKRMVDERANGRKQSAQKAEDRAKARRRQQAMEALSRIPFNGKTLKKSAATT